MLPFLVPVGIWVGKIVIAKSIVGLAAVFGVKTGVATTIGAKAVAHATTVLL